MVPSTIDRQPTRQGRELVPGVGVDAEAEGRRHRGDAGPRQPASPEVKLVPRVGVDPNAEPKAGGIGLMPAHGKPLHQG
jgi:hypothetical protein